MKYNYFIYDGKTVKQSGLVECFESISDSDARKYHENNYKGRDTVLCDSHDNPIY